MKRRIGSFASLGGAATFFAGGLGLLRLSNVHPVHYSKIRLKKETL
jgi:hypothetical protein